MCDALELDYRADFFDCVIDNVSIYANKHNDIVKMYEEIYRLLKPGGKIFTSLFSKNTSGYGMGVEIEKDTFTDIPYGNLAGRGIAHFYDEEEITKLLNKIGYSDIGTEVLHYTDRGNVVELILAEAERPREE